MRLGLVLLLCTWLSGALLAHAEALPPPEGFVLLTVTGELTNPNYGDTAQLDRALLNQLPQHGMTTTTPWTEGPQHFEGPLLADLLARVGARGDELELRALNDYYATIDWKTLSAYPLMLVMRINGRSISVRDKGPIWLLYPMSDYPELDTHAHHANMVWQLSEIEIR